MRIGEDVGAILVRTDGERGVLRLTGLGLSKEVEDIETGQETREFVLVAIRKGQQATVFGHPSIRMFRRS